MTKTVVRSLAFGGVFVVLGFLAIGFWAVGERARLKAPVVRAGRENADTVLSLAAQGAASSDDLDTLVQERGMVAALLVDDTGQVVARAGVLAGSVEEAALDGVSPMPPERKGRLPAASRTVEERMLFRDSRGGFTAVVVQDLGELDVLWRQRRGRVVIAAVVTVLFSPLFGFLLHRFLNARRARAQARA